MSRDDPDDPECYNCEVCDDDITREEQDTTGLCAACEYKQDGVTCNDLREEVK